MDWIQGDKFIGLADFTYSPEVKSDDDYDNLPNTFNLQQLEDGCIIYTHTIYVKKLLRILNNSIYGNQVILITHNSDLNIIETETLIKIKKWYSTNVNIQHPKITSIPIGLENDRWFIKEHKKEKMLMVKSQERQYKNLVYLNHNIKTNPNKRQKPYDVLKDKSWVTVEYGVNGKGFLEYINNVYSHKYVICPEGNGMDTHRVWETLYMGSIPIVLESINNDYYRDLPILMIHAWGELTPEGLNTQYDRIQRKLVRGDYNLNKLNFEYWKNKILKS